MIFSDVFISTSRQVVHLFAPEVTAMKVSCLVAESEGVVPLRINLFKKLKMTPEIRSPGRLMMPRAQTTLLPES